MKNAEELVRDRFKDIEVWSFPVFVALRLLPIVATGIYVYLAPASVVAAKVPLYWAISAFFVLSVFLWVLFASLKVDLDKLLYMVLVLDLVFITVLVYYTGGFASEFYLAYFLLAAVEAIYFGLAFGIFVAVLCSVFYVAGNWGDMAGIYWMHLGLRLFFLVAVAALAGFFAASERERREIKRLNLELDKRLGELTTLYEIGKSIHSTLELDKLLSAILDLISIALRLKSAAVLLSEGGAGDKLRFVMTRGFSAEAGELEFGEGEDCVGWVMKEGKALLVNDAAEDDRFDFFKSVKGDVASFMAVPLITKGEATGVLCATDPGPNAFSADNVRLLVTVAGQISIAIDNARLYEETKRLSETDGLTGLYVSRTFHNSLANEVKRVKRYGGTIAVLMADMDHFKPHNDEYGHPSGDEVLRVAADIIKDSCRSTDIVARYGGEEFAAILIDTDAEAAAVVAERIRREIDEREFFGNAGSPVVHKTISIGIAVFPADAGEKDELMRKADDALYRAKEAGRNKVWFWGGDAGDGDAGDAGGGKAEVESEGGR